jgi:hypothetical protein
MINLLGPASPLAERLSRPSNSLLQRRKTPTRRAIAYIVGFILTYIFSFIDLSLKGAGYREGRWGGILFTIVE